MNHQLPQLLPHCKVPARQFCGSCRDREAGRAFRLGAIHAQGMSDVHPDFECPVGLPWKSRGLGDTFEKLLRKIGIKPCGGCKKRQKKLNKLIPYKGNTNG